MTEDRTWWFPFPFAERVPDNIVYTIYLHLRYTMVPLYVGESSCGVKRFAGYINGQGAVPTDFKVWTAIWHLIHNREVPVSISVLESRPNKGERLAHEQKIINVFHEQGFKLLNDLAGFEHKRADLAEVAGGIRGATDGLLGNARAREAHMFEEREPKVLATRAPGKKRGPKPKISANGHKPRMSTCHPTLQTFSKDGLCAKDHLLAVQAKKQAALEGAMAS